MVIYTHDGECPPAPPSLKQSWTWIGFIHGLDWVQFLVEKNWIGLDYVRSLL